MSIRKFLQELQRVPDKDERSANVSRRNFRLLTFNRCPTPEADVIGIFPVSLPVSVAGISPQDVGLHPTQLMFAHEHRFDLLALRGGFQKSIRDCFLLDAFDPVDGSQQIRIIAGCN